MIILASNSVRRIELLKDAGVDFKVIPSNVVEVIDEKLKPEDNAMNLAFLKANDVFNRNPGDLVIAADTIVTLNNRIFGKPKDEEEAFEMLKTLSNKRHEVITGVAILYRDRKDVFYSKSTVKFKDLTDEQINDYIATKEPFGKAGAYAIQGIGKSIVDTFEGDFFTIVGLPLKDVLKRIKEIEAI
ncbi:Maf family protein [Haploplasma axanthum]|uniref:dTTP/UTP pyrophosphatase n=1 Tax=Haploplasma axanthum TaxID=29552 RepID=A0A449BCA5_HAPAX|nr:Maf family protein [Haploplasma axanthum]VEU80081.1 Septum formation protein Maf [Haploplasma axanthum]